MLLDTIKRHDTKSTIKLVSVEALKSVGKLPTIVHSVPALMLAAEKKLLFGKSVFDHLLLPGSGILLKMQMTTDASGDKTPIDSNRSGEPMAFMLGTGSADTFASYDESRPDQRMDDRSYTWTSYEDTSQPNITTTAPYQEETRQKITLPDIEYIRQQRDMDIRGGDCVINLSQIPPATPTRIV